MARTRRTTRCASQHARRRPRSRPSASSARGTSLVTHRGVGATPLAAVRDAFEEKATTAVKSAIEKLGDEVEGIDISRVICEGRAALALWLLGDEAVERPCD